MSGDETFQEAFLKGEDLHAKVASKIWRTEVSKEHNAELRHRAKAINFGLMYGMGADGLAKRLSIQKHEAQTLMNDYFNQFPKVRGFLDTQSQRGVRDGSIASVSGRTLLWTPKTLKLPVSLEICRSGKQRRHYQAGACPNPKCPALCKARRASSSYGPRRNSRGG